MDRRKFLKVAGASALLAAIPGAALAHHKPSHTRGSQPQPAPTPEPQSQPGSNGPNGISLGCHTGNVQHWGLSTMNAHVAKTGVVPSVILIHQSWQWNNSYDEFYAQGINNIYDAFPNTVVVLTWSQAYSTWPTISSIAQGQHDAYIRRFATNVKAFGRRLILRPFAEMNGDWYMLFSSQPTSFVAAWKRIVGIFREVGVPNVEFFWCPNVSYNGLYPIEPYYPGDSYVDWVGLDGYNWAAAKRNPWVEFEQIFASDLDNVIKKYPKPVIIGETGSHSGPGDKGAWFRNMHSTLKSGRFPQVKGVIYYDYNADGASWVIDAPQSALEFYKAMAQDSYFQANLGAP